MRPVKNISLIEKKCPQCGKVFVPAPEHAYKLYAGSSHEKVFCKYTCMLRYREEHPGKWAKKRAEETGKKEAKK